MEFEPGLLSYATDFQQEILTDADLDGAEQLRPEVFTRLMVERLVESGEVENLEPCHLKAVGLEVYAYGIDDGDTLNLVGAVYRGEDPPASVPAGDVKQATTRLLGFWDRCRKRPYYQELEESSEAYDMARAVHLASSKIRRLRLFIVTDGSFTGRSPSSDEHESLPYSVSLWDIDRLYRIDSSGVAREAIEIDFVKRFGQPVPCLPAGDTTAEYNAMLVVFPAAVLASIYDEFGARLLELNVRSFLQATGKVNKGMRDTLRDNPDRFLAYNNGISATAADVTLVQIEGGGSGIASVRDLQIVNGGQTTASIHRAFRIDKVDLTRVFVQAKLTVVPEELLSEVVPLISRFANSQNKVSEADLSSNDPFHVEIEELSRTVWTPADGDGLRQTRWFYERARGQYRDAENRAGTPARRKAWKETHPPAQKFVKTDVAKFSNAFDQLPHEVSKGAQKSFTLFMNRLKERPQATNVEYFQRLVAKAILWQRTEKLATAQKLGGYRANLVAYAIAKLSHSTAQRIDLDRVWTEQRLDEATESALVELIHVAWKVIVDDAPAGVNITEWAKQERCWRAMKDEPWAVPAAVTQSLVDLYSPPSASAGAKTGKVASTDENVQACSAVAADEWFAISNWAKETANLATWQRSLAFDIGKRMKRNLPPSTRQAQYGVVILEEAARLGYRAEA